MRLTVILLFSNTCIHYMYLFSNTCIHYMYLFSNTCIHYMYAWMNSPKGFLILLPLGGQSVELQNV